MQLRREADNIGREHGAWGEEVAAEYLRIHGYEVLERNSRPCRWDRRLEIDIIAWDRASDAIVFVEVKQHRRRSPYACRLRSISRHKRDLLRRACRTWLRTNRWSSAFRFDVIEVYGEPYSRTKAEVDHIPQVRLFEDGPRFVRWNDSGGD